MTTRPQSEPHLDADQLTAFAEGALSTSERALCLQHLAECAHCREIAFMASTALASEEPVPAPARRFPRSWWSAWWPFLSLGAATIAAVVIAVLLLRHPHQNAPPPNIQVATGSPAVPAPSLSTTAPINQPTPTEPNARSAPKPSPARKAAPRPTPALPDNRQVNDATASDAAAASGQAGAAVPQQLLATGRSVQAAPLTAPAPLAQPSLGQVGGVAKAAPADAVRTYDKLELRTPNGSGQIAGTITDSSGAVVGHARVTLDQTSGTAHRETVTDAAGRFTINSLQPGKYRLEISSPGFMAQVREIELGTSQLARIDSQLAVGAASETVTVEAAASALKTKSASIESLLPDKNPPQTAVTSGARTLALDTAGKLFLSKKAGKHWKTVHGPWKKSSVTNLSLAPDQQFKVTTSQGSWLSDDGEHWHPAN